MRKGRRAVLAILLGGVMLAACAAPPKRVLIVTGEDYKGHDWRATAPVLAAAIAEDPRLAVETVEGVTFSFKAGEFFQNNPYILPKFTSFVREQAAAWFKLHAIHKQKFGGR